MKYVISFFIASTFVLLSSCQKDNNQQKLFEENQVEQKKAQEQLYSEYPTTEAFGADLINLTSEDLDNYIKSEQGKTIKLYIKIEDISIQDGHREITLPAGRLSGFQIYDDNHLLKYIQKRGHAYIEGKITKIRKDDTLIKVFISLSIENIYWPTGIYDDR